MKFKYIVLRIFLVIMVCVLLTSCNASNDKNLDNIFEFTLNEDNTYSISKVNETVNGKIIVPETYNGMPVISIGSNSFFNCKNITEIVIPNTITQIDYAAFNGCSSLEKMTLPFVGRKANVGEKEAEYPLGYIFGCLEFEESVSVKQKYFDHSLSQANNTWTTFYIPKSLKSIIVTGDSLYMGAFSDCSYIESISLTGNVKELKSNLFYDCIRLCEINLPISINSVEDKVFTNTGYYNDNRNWVQKLLYLGNILIAADKNIFGECIIKEGTTVICASAFDECTNLKSVIIPEGITKINEWTFSECSNLLSITIPKSVNYIDWLAFYKCENLEEVHITDISNWLAMDGSGSPLEYANKLYLNNEEIKSVEIPNTISRINSYALSFDSLEQVFVPSSVKIIDSHAFDGATKLKQIYLSEGLESIGQYAFYNCTSLNNIVIPQTVNSIGWCAFDKTALYKDRDFIIGHWLIKGNDSYASYYYTIPDYITHIAEHAFYNNDRIVTVTMSNNVTHIGNEAFSNCDSLNKVIMSENIKVIGEGAFFASHNLKEINLPDGLKYIHKSAFLYCDNLSEIVIPNSVEYIGEKAFGMCDKLTIYCQHTFKPDAWNENWNSDDRPVVWGK